MTPKLDTARHERAASPERAPRVLFVSHRAKLYGAPRSLFLLIRAIGQGSCPVDVRALCYGDGGFPKLVERLGIRCAVVSLPEDVTHPHPGMLARVGRAAQRILATFLSAWVVARSGSDLVYVNTIARVEPILAARIVRRRVIVHVREPARYFEGSTPQQRLRRWALTRLASTVITVSRATAAQLARNGVPEQKLRVVHNGIDEPEVSGSAPRNDTRARLAIREHEVVVGFVGNLNHRKGIDTFVKAAHLLSERAVACRFLVVGGDLSEGYYASHVAPTIDAAGLAPRFVFTGRVDDVDRYYAAMDVVVVPSRAEPFARVNLEAMAHGLPVIATCVDGNPEAVSEGVSGFLVGVDDARAIARRVEQLVEDDALRARLGEAGRKRVREHFSLRRNVEKSCDVIVELAR